MTDFSDPADRAALVARVGITEYTKQLTDWQNRQTAATVNGYPIRRTQTQWGVLYAVVGTRMAFNTQPQAAEHAATLPPRRR